MAVQLHGFDWRVYAEQVMPAFEQWLIEGDEIAALQLFEQTRCAYEERFLPDPMQRLRVWTRARAFAQTLVVRNRTEFELHLQGTHRGREAGGTRTWCALCP